MSKTKELLQQRAEELTRQRDAILAKTGPMREARDRFKSDAFARIRAMDAELKEAEKGLFDLGNELSMIARAAGGRKMSDSRA